MRPSYSVHTDLGTLHEGDLGSKSPKATTYKCDRRIPVLPELPKLVKRVRLPSVARQKALAHSWGFIVDKATEGSRRASAPSGAREGAAEARRQREPRPGGANRRFANGGDSRRSLDKKPWPIAGAFLSIKRPRGVEGLGTGLGTILLSFKALKVLKPTSPSPAILIRL